MLCKDCKIVKCQNVCQHTKNVAEESALRIIERDIKKHGLAFDSINFKNVAYTIKDGHIIIMAGDSGKLAIDFSLLDNLIGELKEIKEVYGR